MDGPGKIVMARTLQYKLLVLTAISSLTLSEITQSAPVDWKHLEEPTVGFSLSYAPDWFVDGQVIATQFALHARCSSVRIIDLLNDKHSQRKD